MSESIPIVGAATTSQLSAPSPNSPRRRRIRLFALLTLIASVSVATFFGGKWWYQRHLLDQSLTEIKKLGGKVVTSADDPRDVNRVYFRGQHFGDSELEQIIPYLQRFPQLSEVDIVDAPVSDAGIRHLFKLRNLRVLFLTETKVTARGTSLLQRFHPKLVIRKDFPDPVATPLTQSNIYRSAINTLAWSPNGQSFASGDGNGNLRFWGKANKEPLRTVAAHKKWLFTAKYSPDGRMLATGGGDSLIKLWDAESLAPMATLAGHTNDIHSIAFHPDGKRLASTGDDKTVRVWDVQSGNQLWQMEGHSNTVPALAVSPDGRLIATGSRDDTIRLWDFDTGESRGTLVGHASDVMSLAFGPDGKWLASGNYDKSVRLWDVAKGQELERLEAHTDWVFAIGLNSAGNHLVSAGRDGRLILWSLDSKQVLDIVENQGFVSSIVFAPKSPQFVIGSAEGFIKHWGVLNDRLKLRKSTDTLVARSSVTDDSTAEIAPR